MKGFSKPKMTMLDREVMKITQEKRTIAEKLQWLLHDYDVAKRSVSEHCDTLSNTMTQLHIGHHQIHPSVDSIAESILNMYREESKVTFVHVYGHLLRCQLIVKKALYAIHNIPDKDVKFRYDWPKYDPNKSCNDVYFSGRYFEDGREYTFSDWLEDIDEDLDTEIDELSLSMQYSSDNVRCRMFAYPIFDKNGQHSHTNVNTMFNHGKGEFSNYVEYKFKIPANTPFSKPIEMYEQLPIITTIVNLNVGLYFVYHGYIEKDMYKVVCCDDYHDFMNRHNVVGKESLAKMLCYEEKQNRNHLYITCSCNVDSIENPATKNIYLTIMFAQPKEHEDINNLEHDICAKFKIEYDDTVDEPCIEFREVIDNIQY